MALGGRGGTAPTLFLNSAREGGEWSASRPGRALPPGKEPPVPIVQEAGWAPEPVWTRRLEEKCSASVGDRTPAVQSVVRHYTDWANLLIHTANETSEEMIFKIFCMNIITRCVNNHYLTCWVLRLQYGFITPTITAVIFLMAFLYSHAYD
jgi:hypothetical protein